MDGRIEGGMVGGWVNEKTNDNLLSTRWTIKRGINRSLLEHSKISAYTKLREHSMDPIGDSQARCRVSGEEKEKSESITMLFNIWKSYFHTVDTLTSLGVLSLFKEVKSLHKEKGVCLELFGSLFSSLNQFKHLGSIGTVFMDFPIALCLKF